MSRARVVRCRLTILLAIACVPVALGAQQKPQNDADAKEIASYRLTMESYRKLVVVYRELADEAKKDPNYQELRKVEAELETLQKKDEPSDADSERIEALSARRQQLNETLDKPGRSLSDTASLDEMAAEINKEPRFADALAKAGMSAREFSKFTLAMFGAAFAASAQKAGMLKELPKEVNPDNVKFILEHEAELQKLQEEMKAFEK